MRLLVIFFYWNYMPASTYLELSNKIDELNRIKSIFSQNQINDLICDRLKQINQLQNSIQLNKLYYKTKSEKKIIT